MIKTLDFLPLVFQTPANQKFLNSTLDQLVAQPDFKKVNGYIGRKFAPTYKVGDNYIQEPTTDRQNYQLEPSVVSLDSKGNTQFFSTYTDLLQQIEYYGGITNNHTRLFSQESYSFDGQFDFDKFVNFNQYYWLPSGPSPVGVYSIPVDTQQTYTVTRNLLLNAYNLSGYNSSNPELILARGGTYQFEVNQPGFNFWIQTEPSLDGSRLTQPNINTRQVLGVTNNGTDNGIINFIVPQQDAQDGFVTMPVTSNVDYASNLTFIDIHNQLLDNIIANFGGIDGVTTNLNGKSLIFTSNDLSDENWEISALYGLDTYDSGAYDVDPYDPYATNVSATLRNDIWQIQIVDADGEQIVKLHWVQSIPVGEKVFIKAGNTYANFEFYKVVTGLLQPVPLITAPLNVLYYNDSSNAALYGTIRIVDPLSFQINVDTEIVGKKAYTSPNGVVFTNGLKVAFDETASPVSYVGNEYYVEGVGKAIKLLHVDTFVIPELSSGSASIPFDVDSYDTTPFDATVGSVEPDYLTINRASVDGNAWTRSNRWFHTDVITATATYNNTTPLFDQTLRSSRPIIEFNPNLQLFNYGRTAQPYVNLVDFTVSDAFTQIQNSTDYNDAIYQNGTTIIFASDNDPIVRNKVYTINIVTIPAGTYYETSTTPTNAGSFIPGNTYTITTLGTTAFAAIGASNPVLATTLVPSTLYIITSIGTTDFTLIGASSNTVGLSFTATASGAGTGTASVPPYIEMVFTATGSGSGTGIAYEVTATVTSPAVSFIDLLESPNGDIQEYDVVVPTSGVIVNLLPSEDHTLDSNVSYRKIDYTALPTNIGTFTLSGVLSPGYVNAGSFVPGDSYVIEEVNTTDFTLIGASSNAVGVTFTATGIGSGDGIARVSGTYGTGLVTGYSFWYNNSAWTQTQQKTAVNQAPLFDIVNNNLISFADPNMYAASTFYGNKIFSYLEGTGEADPILAFPISYRNINNVGDITFVNNYDTDSFSQLDGLTAITNKVNSGFIAKIVDSETLSKANMWTTRTEDSKQYQVISKIYNGTTSQFQIDILPDQSVFVPNLKVFVNSKELDSTTYAISQVGSINYVVILSPLTINDEIDILIYSSTQVSKIGYYEIPSNLDFNALNQNFSELTHGQFRNHLAAIASNTTEIVGQVPGDSNLRDLDVKPSGGSILQHGSPAIYGELFLLNKDLNFMDASAYAQQEYNRFKNRFLESFASVVNAGITDPVIGVDTIMLQLNAVKNNQSPWYYSDMVPYGGNKTTITYTVLNISLLEYEIDSIFNDTMLSNRAILVYLNGTQLIKDIDYTFNQERPSVIFNTTLDYGDIITIDVYSNTDGNFIPETPTKLGLYPKFTPEIFVDTSYQTPTTVLRGHDGSITPAFGDMRDNLLLELEKRIYNNIKIVYDINKFDIFKYVPGKFRSTEYNKTEFDLILSRSFMEWISNNRTDYSENIWFTNGNPFSWTYSSFKDVVDGEYLPGYWKGIYTYFYDTAAPHLRPWECLGFSERPDWWVAAYGPSPYTGGNMVLWNDLEEGIIREGPRAGTHQQYARPGLSSIIPVTDSGILKAPSDFLVTAFNGTNISGTFVFGDNGPVEAAWRTSSHYPFALQQALALMKPAVYFSQLANVGDYSNVNPLNQWLFIDTNQRLTAPDFEINGETVSAEYATSYHPAGTILRQAGYLNWVSDYIVGNGTNGPALIHSYLDTLQVRLGYRVAGFTDQNYISVYADQVSPNSTNESIVIPDENYEVYVHKSSPTSTLIYSGVIIEKTSLGFSVSGYSSEQPYFTVIPSNPNNNSYTISAAGATGIIYNNYQTVSVTIPYGHEFSNKQQVVDFLISYGRYLISQGFTFTDVDTDLQVAKDWILAAKEFLTWTQQGWAVGNIIVLSPISNSIAINTPNGVIDAITNTPAGSKIMDVGFNIIKSNLFTVIRDNGTFRLTTAAPNISIGLLDVSVVQYENALIFDNETVFNDIIYKPELGNRQYRLKLIGTVTQNWTGEFNPPGFIYSNPDVPTWQQGQDYREGDLVQYDTFLYTALQNIDASDIFKYALWSQIDKSAFKTGMLPNLSYNASKFLDMYDVDNQIADQNINEYAMGLIGFRNRDYLTQLRVDTTSQVKFYQGFIRDKGTKNSINALASATFENMGGTLNFYEEWALRMGSYGSTDSNQFLEVQLHDDLYTFDPLTLALLNNDESVTDTGVVGVYEKDLYKTPTTFTPNIFKNRNATSIYSDDIATAGYVNLADVDATAFDITNMESLNPLIVDIRTGYKLWVAKDNTRSWNVYRFAENTARVTNVLYQLNGYAQFTTSIGHGLLINEVFAIKGFSTAVDGFYTVLRVDSDTTIFAAITSALDKTMQVTPDITGSGGLFNLNSMRVQYETNILDITPRLGWIDQDTVWVDNNAANNWAVYKKTEPWTPIAELLLNTAQLNTNDVIGSSIATTEDGLLMVVGAPGEGILPGDGTVKTFTKIADNYSASVVLRAYNSPNKPFVNQTTLSSLPYIFPPYTYDLGYSASNLNVITVVRDDAAPGLGLGIQLTLDVDYSITYTDPTFSGNTSITFNGDPSSLTFRVAETKPEKFGTSIAVKNSIIAAGAPTYQGTNGIDEGRVVIYRADTDGTTHVVQVIDPEILNSEYLTALGANILAGSNFGSTVSLSEDSQWLYVGSPSSQWNGGIGTVYAFRLKEISSAEQSLTTTAGQFTYSITVGNLTDTMGLVVVNQYYTLINGIDYTINTTASTITFLKDPGELIYTITQGSYYDFNSVITPDDGISGDNFGASLETQANGRYLLVGSPNKAFGTMSNVGQAYLFIRSVQDIIADGVTSAFTLYQVPNQQSNAQMSSYSMSGYEDKQVLLTATDVYTYNLTFDAAESAIITVTPNVAPHLDYTINYDANQITFDTNPGNVQCNITQSITSVYNFVPNITPNITLVSDTLTFDNAPGKNLVIHIELNNFDQIHSFNSNNSLGLYDGATFGAAVAMPSYIDEFFVSATGTITQDGQVFRFTNPSVSYNTAIVEMAPSAENIVVNNMFIDLTSTNIANITAFAETITNQNIVGLTASEDSGNLRLTYSTTVANDNLTIVETDVAGNIVALGATIKLTQILQHPVISRYAFSNSKFGSAMAYEDTTGTLVVAAANAPTIEKFNLDNYTTFFDGNSTTIFDVLEDTGAVYTFEELNNPLNSIDSPSKFIFTQQFTPDNLSAGINFGSAIAINYNSIFIGANHATVDTFTNAGKVYYYSNPSLVGAWGQIREQTPQVDLASITKIYLYDRVSQSILSSLDFIDPAKGKILGIAEQDITYKSSFDPARYNVGDNTIVSINAANYWGKQQVGQIWWDLSQVRYINYEQDTLTYRLKHWGELFPNSTIKINEWVESSVPPSQYAGDGTVTYADAGAYVQTTKISPSTGFVVSTYYFWVTDRTQIDPGLDFRHSTALSIANMISSPATQNTPYAAFMQDNAIAMFESSHYLNADRTIIHVDYEVIPSDIIIHNEYEIIQENSPTAILPTAIVNKLVDSLTSADQFGNPVPDIDLGVAEKYGITIRPRQTMFVDSLAASKNVVEFANTIFLKTPIVEEFDLTNMYLSDPVPVTWGNLFPVTWAPNTEYVADELVIYAGVTYLVRFNINSGTVFNSFYYEPAILPDVSVEAPIELTYLDTAAISIHQAVLVLHDSAYNNGWALYQLQVDRTFSVIRTETYQTANYWSKIDWFDPTYDSTIKPTYTVASIPDMGNLTLVSGDVVWITNNGSGLFTVYRVNDDLSKSMVGLQEGTIQLSDALWDHEKYEIGFDNDRFDSVKFDLNPTTEYRNILNALHDDIFIDSLAGQYNNMFFLLLNYILSEQRMVDWAIKTSFVSVIHQLRKLEQFPNYLEDNQTYYEDYINEVKPYRTTIREYIIDYEGFDDANLSMSDFDLPPYFDTEFNMWRSPNGEHAKDAEILATYPQYADWNANHTYSIGSVIISVAGYGYTVPPVLVVEGGGGTGAILEAKIDPSLGGVVAITVVNPGTGYTTTPTIIVYGNGVDTNGDQTCRLYPLLSNQLIRSFDTTLKFDRVSYASDVKQWAKYTTFNGGDIVAYNNAVYTVNGNATINSGSVFELSNYTTLAEDTLNAVDRVAAFYSPTTGMLPNNPASLFVGIEYPGNIVDGTNFEHYVDGNGIEYTVDKDGNHLAIDSNIHGFFGDSLLGTRPEDINVDGGHFVDTYNSHAPEELVPGRVYDTLDMKVFTIDTSNPINNPLGYRMTRNMTAESNLTFDIEYNTNWEVDQDNPAYPSTTFDSASTSFDFAKVRAAWEFKRICAAASTTLAANLAITDTSIYVTNAATLYNPNPASPTPGIVYINSEKIIYWGLDQINGIITNFRRGTWGTGAPELHLAGSIVVDASKKQTIPGDTIVDSWLDLATVPGPGVILQGNGLRASSTTEAAFLQACPSYLPYLP